jgi:hypothetical protein
MLQGTIVNISQRQTTEMRHCTCRRSSDLEARPFSMEYAASIIIFSAGVFRQSSSRKQSFSEIVVVT